MRPRPGLDEDRGSVRTIIALLLSLLLILVLTTHVAAQMVRGQVVFRNGVPAGGVAVRVFNSQRGPSGTSYTGYDGLFYLSGIPPGDYDLQVMFKQQPMPPVRIRVFRQPYTDIPRYFLPW